MKNRIFIFIIIALCILPTALMPVCSGEGGANESEKLFPELTQKGKINTSYLSQLSDWFDKSFGGRDFMISVHNKAIAAIFSESAEDKVVYGEDGWLFYSETLPDYQKTNILTPRELDGIKHSLELAEEFLSTNGIDFAFTVAPNKNSLYGSKMPARYIKNSGSSNAELLADTLAQTDINYINLFDAFAKESRVLYRKTDSHWTHQGAGLAADTILGALGREHTAYYGGETYAVPAEGDLHKMLFPAFDDKTGDVRYKRQLNFDYARPMRSPEDNFIYTSNPGKEGKLFMFRDSFGNTLYEYMADSFGSCVFSRSVPYDLTQPLDNGSDTVVIEIVERNIRNLLKNPPIFPAPARSGDPGSMADITDFAAAEITDDGEFCKISGKVPADGERWSEVYIYANSQFYEATPCADGFCAYLPVGCADGGCRIYQVKN